MWYQELSLLREGSREEVSEAPSPLSRETLRLLESKPLKQVDGGSLITQHTSNGTSCPSYCQVSGCI